MNRRCAGTRGRVRWEVLALILLGLYVASGLVEKYWRRPKAPAVPPLPIAAMQQPVPPVSDVAVERPPEDSREELIHRCVAAGPIPDRIIRVVSLGGFPKDSAIQTLAGRWLNCMAIGRRDPTFCAAGKSQPPAEDMESSCRRFMSEGQWLYSAAYGKPNQGACGAAIKAVGATEIFSPQELPGMCRWISEHLPKKEIPDDYPCEDLSGTRFFASGLTISDLRAKGACYRMLLHCEHSGVRDYWAPGCQEAFTLWRALSAGKSACAALPECEALSSGTAAPCDAIRRDLAREFCRLSLQSLPGGKG